MKSGDYLLLVSGSWDGRLRSDAAASCRSNPICFFAFRIVPGVKTLSSRLAGWLAGQAGWLMVYLLVEWPVILARLGGPPPCCATRRTLVGQKKGIFPATSATISTIPSYPTLPLRVKFPGSVPTHTSTHTHTHTPYIVLYPYVGVSGMMHQVATLTQPFFKSNQYPDRPKLLLLSEESYLNAVP